MRRPSEFIAAAVRGIHSRLMDDCALPLTFGGITATVTRAAPQTRGEDEISGESAAEHLRVLALASDFPAISKGDTALLGSGFRIVTSVRSDVAGVSLYIGFSDELEKVLAAVSGVRGNRPVRFPLGILAVNNGLAADITDGYAPTSVHSWTICVAADDWPELGEPQIGDELKFEKDGADVRVKVARCNRRERHFVINARSR